MTSTQPDGTQRFLIGEIIKRFETKGYKLVAIKVRRLCTTLTPLSFVTPHPFQQAVVPSRTLAEKHYEDLKGRPFFNGTI